MDKPENVIILHKVLGLQYLDTVSPVLGIADIFVTGGSPSFLCSVLHTKHCQCLAIEKRSCRVFRAV